MPPLAREEKLVKALRAYEGEWKSAKQILKWMSDRWTKTGYSSPKALGLFLRRYRFEKEGNEYLIEGSKIDKREAIGAEW